MTTRVKRLVKVTEITSLNGSAKSTFNSDTVELLGYTHEFLNANSGLQLPDNILALAMEIALTSGKLNLLCQKFDKLISTEKVLEVHKKRIEWSAMMAQKRVERMAKERQKLGKALRGQDKKIYQKTGELPREYESRIREAFLAFKKQMEATEVR